jgi:uroporphyrinogen decarboxylase
MSTTAMNGKERVEAALTGERVDRMPAFYMGTEAVNRAVMEALGSTSASAHETPSENEVAIALGADVVFVRPRFAAAEGRIGGFRTQEVHAHMHREAGYESVEIPRGPLADAATPDDVLAVDCWPSADHFDYDLTAEDRERCETHCAVARGNNSMFLSASALRGMERLMMDMALDPELATAVFERVVDFHVERLERFLAESGELIDVVDIGDDIAGQNGMLFSVDMFRTFIRPQLERLVRVIRRHGKVALFFGCGGFRDVLDDFAELGIVNAGRMQSEARGNDFVGLVRDYGGSFVFWGALDAQHALIERDAAGAASHVREIVGMSQGRGLVAGPTHTFTEDTPIANVLACYRELGTIG